MSMRAFIRIQGLLALVLLSHVPGAAALPGPAGESAPTVQSPAVPFQPRPGTERVPARLEDLVRASSRLTAAERQNLGPLTAQEQVRIRPEVPYGRLRQKIGIARDLAEPVILSDLPQGLPAGAERAQAGGLARREANGRLSWTTAFLSPGARAVRLHLSEARLPAGSRVYVYNDKGEVHGPYAFDTVLPAEGFWTNSVAGEQIYLEVQISGTGGSTAACRLVVSQVGHMASTAAAAGLAPDAAAAPEDTSCFVDAACITSSDFASLANVSHAVAALAFSDQGTFYLCSGALIGAVGDASTPYLLTANHCFSTQASATSLEATFNFIDSTCNQQPFPDEGPFPTTLGSSLIATGTTSDFTLVLLSQSPPSGAVLLGFSTSDVSTTDGLTLYRLSHPAPSGIPWPQYYTRQVVVGSPLGTCTGAAQGNFLYETQNVGGTTGGSSGSPLCLSNGMIVGQLNGKCGSDLTNDCDAANNYLLDGAFQVTYASVSQWLNPQSTGSCTPSSTVLCLSNNRFQVSANWQSTTASGAGMAISLRPDTGYFWFFNSSNVEMVIKVLDACSLNSKYWVFAGGLTNVNVTITVTDTQNDTVRTYVNPQSAAFQPIQDTSAFSTCP